VIIFRLRFPRTIDHPLAGGEKKSHGEAAAPCVSSVHVNLLATRRARLKNSKILPATQLLREGAARAIGCIAQAKIFVDLEQSLLSDQGTQEDALPRIAGK